MLGLALGLAFAASTTGAQAPRTSRKTDSTTVVFVCEHGSVKSLIAISWFNRLAKSRGLPLRAISRGTNPDSAVPRAIRDGLRGDGIDIGSFKPKLLGKADLAGATMLVSFDQDVAPVVQGALPVERWDALPAVSLNYALGRDSIRARVTELVTRLEAKRSLGRR